MNSLEILNKFSSKDEHGNRIWKESEILEAIDFASNEKQPAFTTDTIEKLQYEVYKITGDGEVMMLFNSLLGVSSKM